MDVVLSLIAGCIIVGLIIYAIRILKVEYEPDKPVKQDTNQPYNNVKTIQEQNHVAITNWLQKEIENFNTWIRGMEETNGKISVKVPIIPNEPHRTLLVFKDKQEIYISSTWIKFKDIISCQLIDNPKVTAGSMKAVTKRDLWDEINRSSMQRTFGKTTGTFLAGPQKYVTEYQQTPDMVYHNYSVLVGTSDIENPLHEIKIGDDIMIANKVCAVINAIIANKNN